MTFDNMSFNLFPLNSTNNPDSFTWSLNGLVVIFSPSLSLFPRAFSLSHSLFSLSVASLTSFLSCSLSLACISLTPFLSPSNPSPSIPFAHLLIPFPLSGAPLSLSLGPPSLSLWPPLSLSGPPSLPGSLLVMVAM